ncbi:MAG: LptF/LptG family permease [Candidatus Omnitrophota bacterium]
MKILEKYILKSFVLSFIFCITLLIVLGVIGDILGFLDDIVKNNIPFMNVVAFYFYLAPFAFVNMVPFASLLSAVYVFNSLSKHHEVTAVIASGVSLWRLLRPVLVVTFLLCLATFIINDKFVPVTMEKANHIRQEKLEKSETAGDLNIKDLAVYCKDDQIIYAKSFSPKIKEFHDMIIHRRQVKETFIGEKINARVVKWKEDGYWEGENVIIFKSDSNGNFTKSPETYQKKILPISETPEEFIKNQNDPRFMSYRQLKRHLKIFNAGSSLAIRRLLVDLNYKLALPFTALITVLAGVPFSIETGRASALIGMARGILVAILYLPVMAVSLALGKGGILPPVISAWLSNVVFALIGVYFIDKRS